MNERSIIPGFSKYTIDKKGNVFKNKNIIPMIISEGLPVVKLLSDNGNLYNCPIYKLMLITFSKCNKDTKVRYKDRDPFNLSVDNILVRRIPLLNVKCANGKPIRIRRPKGIHNPFLLRYNGNNVKRFKSLTDMARYTWVSYKALQYDAKNHMEVNKPWLHYGRNKRLGYNKGYKLEICRLSKDVKSVTWLDGYVTDLDSLKTEVLDKNVLVRKGKGKAKVFKNLNDVGYLLGIPRPSVIAGLQRSDQTYRHKDYVCNWKVEYKLDLGEIIILDGE